MEFAATVLILTCTYALLAAGVVILYKAARVVNFAHGELAIVGGYVFYSASLMFGGSLWSASGLVAFSAPSACATGGAASTRRQLAGRSMKRRSSSAASAVSKMPVTKSAEAMRRSPRPPNWHSRQRSLANRLAYRCR